MLEPRRLSAVIVAAVIGAGLVAPGCGTDPVGVDDCRRIEQARCAAAEACGIVDDVEACQRYYREHCLHGLAAAERPGAPAMQDCVDAIEAAGACARDAGDVALGDCPDGPPATPTDADVTGPCDVVEAPELVEECSFLLPVPPDPMGTGGEGGAGGSSGAGGDSAG
jgi:hypothetical protein